MIQNVSNNIDIKMHFDERGFFSRWNQPVAARSRDTAGRVDHLRVLLLVGIAAGTIAVARLYACVLALHCSERDISTLLTVLSRAHCFRSVFCAEQKSKITGEPQVPGRTLAKVPFFTGRVSTSMQRKFLGQMLCFSTRLTYSSAHRPR